MDLSFEGTFFLITFLVYQVSMITCVFLTISTLIPKTVVASKWQYIIQSLGFIVMAYYFMSTLYFITMTAEKAHKNLKMLASPLQQELVMESDQPKIQSLKILLKEVENVGPLSGRLKSLRPQ